MNKLDLIEQLIGDINALKLRDENSRDALSRKSEMIVRKIFGDKSKYLKDLNINFWPMYAPSSEQDKNEAWISGTNEMRNLFNTMKQELLLFEGTVEIKSNNTPQTENKKDIFIVHGKDETMKVSVARVIEKIGLTPLILHEQPNKGRTVIEKFSDYSNVSFSIVLLSPDDIGFSNGTDPSLGKSRARQNVILELGYFLGKLGRERVLTLYKDESNFEIPSDYSGVLFVPFDINGRWQFDLVKELKACGFPVDANKLL